VVSCWLVAGDEVKQKGEYTKPVEETIHDGYDLSEKVIEFFKTRKISLSTLKKFKVTGNDKAINFNFYKGGELINVKKRRKGKKFSLEPNCEINFYNYDAIKEDPVIITEGEIDALTVYECAPSIAVVSLPNGSNSLNFLDGEIETLEKTNEIIIATDGDQAGIKARDALIIRFGAARTSYLTYPDGTKDLNEVLIKYGKEKVLETINKRKKVPIKAVYSAEDYNDVIYRYICEGFPPGLITGIPVMDKVVRLGLGEFVVVSGTPSAGKSTLMDYLSIHHLKNNEGLKVGMLSAENSIPIQALKLARHLTGKEIAGIGEAAVNQEILDAMDFVYNNYKFISTSEMDMMNYKTVVQKLEEMNKSYGCNYFIIDPYNYIDRDSTDHTSHGPVLKAFANFAKKYNSLVILVAHPKKMEKDSNGNYAIVKPYDISGSSDFFNIADTILSFWRNFLDPDAPNDLYVQKVRNEWNGTAPGTIPFMYNRESKTFYKSF